MSGTIFLIGEDGKLQEMKQEPYKSEALFQKDLAEYPNLLAGDQINQSDPRRWVLVKREMGVPGEEDGSGRWAVDHLFLDQDGIPTLVEIKRSTDTRSRREVVAQMLDYAANATVYWSVDQIQAAFQATCEATKTDPIRLLTRLLRPEADEGEKGTDQQNADDDLIEFDDNKMLEDYWEKVKTNLQAEKIRLIFMADRIQPELRRIVEFLNGQMSRAEVLAVQVPLYVGGKQRALVPMVIGQTTEAERSKGPGPRQTEEWNEEKFFESVKKNSPDKVETVQKIYQWFIDNDMPFRWGRGVTEITATPTFHMLWLFFTIVASPSKDNLRIKIPLGTLRSVPPFKVKSNLQELLGRLNRIDARLKLDNTMIDGDTGRFPNLPVSYLQNEEAMNRFFDTVKWTVEQIQGASETTPES